MQGQPVTKTIGGVTFEDRFAHVQDDTPEALEWQWELDRRAREVAVASPNYQPVLDRLLQLIGASSTEVARKRGGLWIAFDEEAGERVVRAGDAPDQLEGRVVSTSNIEARTGASGVEMVWLEPSPRGRFIAVGWGASGDMLGTWSAYETSTGRHVVDAPAIISTGARVGWMPDESGFWHNDRAVEGQHRLSFVPVAQGAIAREALILSEELVPAKYSGLTLQVAPDSRRAVAVAEPWEHVAVVQIDLETQEVTPFLPDGFEGECDGSWLDAETYVARVNSDAPRGRVVAIPAATSRDIGTWRELIPEGEGFMSWAGIVGGRLYVGDLVDVSLRVRVFDLDGNYLQTLPLDNPGSASSMMYERCIRSTDALALKHATFTRSDILVVHDPATGELRQYGEPRFRLDDVVAEQRFATSADGTRVPYFMVYRKDLDLDRPQPALFHAYGGFNTSKLPTFKSTYVPFIEAGGIFIQASLRGGGEYGKAWHDGGRHANQPNTFADLQAIAETVIAEGLSTPEQMAFHGMSNGGLVAGAAIVFQPHLWRVVAPQVPVYDMMELVPFTPDTAWVRAIMYEDYGDPTLPDVAQTTIQWSPYHNIRDGVDYPAVYQMFGEKDLACMPFQGRKFTGRLQEANSGDRPIHLRVWRDTGHDTEDAAAMAANDAEWLAFVMDQIGLNAKAVSQ